MKRLFACRFNPEKDHRGYPERAPGSRTLAVWQGNNPIALAYVVAEVERLLEHVQRRLPREWARLRRLSSEGIAQVQQAGWCGSLGERDQNASMTHIAIQEALDGKPVEWLERVTDEQYLAGPSKTS